MNNLVKKIGYKVLHILSLGKGISKVINGILIKFPVKYFRYFPNDYEKENFELIKNNVKKGDIIIDIGAHIGLISVFLGKKVGASGKVYSFEPTPDTFLVLKKIIKLNKLQEVVIPINKAISIKGGFIEFSANLDNVSNSIISYEYNKDHKRIQVITTSIDEFVQEKNITKLDFIKIDAEGVELDVLKGAIKTFHDFNCKIILALHPLPIIAKGDTLGEIFDIISKYHYKVIWHNSIITKQQFCEQKNMFDVFLEKY